MISWPDTPFFYADLYFVYLLLKGTWKHTQRALYFRVYEWYISIYTVDIYVHLYIYIYIPPYIYVSAGIFHV